MVSVYGTQSTYEDGMTHLRAYKQCPHCDIWAKTKRAYDQHIVQHKLHRLGQLPNNVMATVRWQVVGVNQKAVNVNQQKVYAVVLET